MIEDRIHRINRVVQEYFNQHPEVDVIPAKDLMPEFIEAGIYGKDHRNGLPLRKDLRKLDREGSLNRIPYILTIRKNKNTYWYFIPSGADKAQIQKDLIEPKKKAGKKRTSGVSEKSDEDYILDLCDEVLGIKGSRQHRFDFLKGDLSAKTNRRVKLPCDIYYPELNLVIEYNEKQHTESVSHFDKPDKKTISGVHRGQQRRHYDERRRKVLPEHGIRVVDFSYIDFKHTSNRRLIRNNEDIEVVRIKLQRLGVIV